MVEKSPAGRGQFGSLRTANQELNADLGFEIADLAAERGLGGVQPLLGGHRQAAGLGNSDEISDVAELHKSYLPGMTMSLQSLFQMGQREPFTAYRRSDPPGP